MALDYRKCAEQIAANIGGGSVLRAGAPSVLRFPMICPGKGESHACQL